MAMSRKEATGLRRREILEATLRVFIEEGDSGTFIQQVCARSEVSVGTLYHHFGSKDQLIATLHYSLLDQYQSGAGPILGADPPAEEGIRRTVEYHLRWLVTHPDPANFLLQQPFAGYRSDRIPDELLESNEAFLRTVHGWLDRRMGDGSIKQLPFDVVVALLIGPVHHWARAQLFLDPARAARKLDAASDELADGAWHALAPHRREPSSPRLPKRV